MKKFEYKNLYYKYGEKDQIKKMNKAGKKGWEAYCIFTIPYTSVRVYFKRELEEQEEQDGD